MELPPCVCVCVCVCLSVCLSVCMSLSIYIVKSQSVYKLWWFVIFVLMFTFFLKTEVVGAFKEKKNSFSCAIDLVEIL